MSGGIDPHQRLAEAEARAIAAREQLTGTLNQLQERLNPKLLAERAAREAADAGSKAARVGVETARRNPGAVAGLSAVAGLFLARHRIADLFSRKGTTDA
ncbi:hypothetical protein GGQ80_000844 [Sphingomonas jinjuensis]|uniref:DUF3618 domain-containing protein n=1 Tax=Sphingomonas jinjuensis TaxID=535907 RepID=A0A840F9I2_9SPHN|nr:hypothetical protein [Sphingomonas jinjuensis]